MWNANGELETPLRTGYEQMPAAPEYNFDISCSTCPDHVWKGLNRRDFLFVSGLEGAPKGRCSVALGRFVAAKETFSEVTDHLFFIYVKILLFSRMDASNKRFLKPVEKDF